MRLTREIVSEVLTKEGIAFECTAEGYELPDGRFLRSGSGIAGKNYEWFLWHLDGHKSQETVTNRSTLRRLMRAIFCKRLPRVTEPSFSPDMVHYGPPVGLDQVTLCGKTDWLGETTGESTDRPATCNACIAIVNHVRAYRA